MHVYIDVLLTNQLRYNGYIFKAFILNIYDKYLHKYH